ncbi:LOW QUALITY PROTEIN: hypothetical protein YC2023_058698 [Brassica napus]
MGYHNNCHQDCLPCSPAPSTTSHTSNSGDDVDQFPGASVACESALGSTCSGGPCEASAPNSASGEKKRPKRREKSYVYQHKYMKAFLTYNAPPPNTSNTSNQLEWFTGSTD